MENDRLAGGSLRQNVVALVMFAIGIVRSIAQPDIVQFVLRIALAVPFWKSGILKWSGFLHLSDTAVTLFTDEFMIHLPGGPYPYPAPTVFAFLSGSGEIIFPILLVLGLAARFAALGLLFMTVIVELTVPDGWPIHITWAAMALAIMAACRAASPVLQDRVQARVHRHVAGGTHKRGTSSSEADTTVNSTKRALRS
jgi:putative oxidoreductase